MTEIRRSLFQGAADDVKVNFNDTTTFISATYHYQAIDEDTVLNIVYGVGDLLKSLDDRLENALKSTCGLYTVDEANMSKGFFDLCSVITHNEEVEKMLAEGRTLKNLTNAKRLKIISNIHKSVLKKGGNCEGTRYYTEFEAWGVRVSKLSLINIVIPEHIQKAREQTLEANEELEASLIKNETAIKLAETEAKNTVVKAEAAAKEIELRGKALAKQIEALTNVKLSPQEAQEMLTNFEKWKSLGEKTVVLENGSSSSILKVLIEAGILAKAGFDLNGKKIGG
jgi:regulator of protease activity HflC (stomatin/prohibitin superfamily)